MRRGIPPIELRARNQKLSDLVDQCARGEIKFDALCATVHALGYSTLTLYDVVKSREADLKEQTNVAQDRPGTDYHFEELKVTFANGVVWSLDGKVFLTWDGDRSYALERTVVLSRITRIAPTLYVEMPIEVFTENEIAVLSEAAREALNKQDLSEWLAEKTRY